MFFGFLEFFMIFQLRLVLIKTFYHFMHLHFTFTGKHNLFFTEVTKNRSGYYVESTYLDR